MTCTPKSMGVQLGQRGTGCSTRTLASAGLNCSDTTQNPKMTRKEEAQFPPTHIHTHTCAGAIHKGSVFEKFFLSEVTTPITLNTKFAPLSPQKNISDPLRPTPSPSAFFTITLICLINGGSRGIQGGSL